MHLHPEFVDPAGSYDGTLLKGGHLSCASPASVPWRAALILQLH